MSDYTSDPSEQVDSSFQPPRSSQNPKTNLASLSNLSGQFKFGAAPKPATQQARATPTESSTQANSSFPNSNSHPFKPASKSGPSSSATSSTGEVQKRRGGLDGSLPSLDQGRTNSLEHSDGEDGDTIVTVPVPKPSSSIDRRPATASSATPGPALSKGGLDLSRFNLGAGIGSPLHPALASTQSRSSNYQASSHHQAGAANRQSNQQANSNQDYSLTQSLNQPRSLAPSSTQHPLSHNSSHHSDPPQNQQSNNSKKRSFSDDPPTRNSPPVQPQPRSNTAGSTSTAQGLSNVEAKRRRVDASGAASVPRDAAKELSARNSEVTALTNEVITDLSVKKAEILHLRQQVVEKSNEAKLLREEAQTIKKTLTDRARQAIASADQANQALLQTASDMKEAMRTSRSEGEDQIREELESLRKDYRECVENQHKLEKNEEARVSVLRELQCQLTNRDDVIKLLRDELDQKTGEILEARDTNALLEDRRQSLEFKITQLNSDLELSKLSHATDRSKLADQIESSLVSAKEREEQQKAKMDELEAKWSGKVWEARGREDKVNAEVRELRAKLEEKEWEVQKGKRAEIDYEAKLQVLQASYSEEKRELSTQLKTAQEEANQVPAIKNELAIVNQNLEAARESVQGLVDSRQQDQEAHETSIRILRGQVEGSQSHLTMKTSEAEDYKSRIGDLQARIASADASRSTALNEASAAEIQTLKDNNKRLRTEKDEVELVKKRLEEQLATISRQLDTLTVERDTVSMNVRRLESALAASRTTAGTQQTENLEISRQLSASQMSQAALESELEGARKELEKLKTVEEQLKEVKDGVETAKQEYARLKVREAKAACEETYARDKVELSNKLKKTENVLQTTNNTLNKVRNELALHKDKRVLNPNMASSSNPSNPESQGTVSTGNGSQGKDGNGQLVATGEGNVVGTASKIEPPVVDFDDAPNANTVFETVKRTEQTLNTAFAYHSSSSLSPIEAFSDEVIAQDTEKDKGKEGKVKKSKKGKGKVVNEEALQPTTATSKRRKRSRDSDSGSRSTSIENPPVTTKSRKRSRVVVGGTEEGEAGTKEIEEQKEEKVKSKPVKYSTTATVKKKK